MKEIINALMNLNRETVVIRYNCGKTITGHKQFIDVFSKTVILKNTDDDSYHNVNFDAIEELIIQDAQKQPKILKKEFTLEKNY